MSFLNSFQASACLPNINRLFERAVPAANAYWRTGKQYILPCPGYYFMPVFYELLYKKGVDAKRILEESHLTAVECILDSVARYESKEIHHNDHLLNCQLVLKNHGFTQAQIAQVESDLVTKPFDVVPPVYCALTRANTFLYATALISDNYSLIREVWESFMPLILFADDAEDLDDDHKNGEENALLEASSIEAAIFELHPILQSLLASIQTTSPFIFNHFDELRQMSFQNSFYNLIKG